MTKIADFTDTELWIIQTTLKERYRSEVAVHLADTEVSLTPGKPNLISSCPAVFWDYNQTSFVVIKVGEHRYWCHFFGRDLGMFRPDKQEYDEVADCVVTLLQVQADHERRRSQQLEGSSKGKFNG
ncbi:MAG: hypothetical protein WAN46_20250 [Gammaproteobacteria bacterium]